MHTLYLDKASYKKKKSAETLLLHNDNATTRTSETQVSQTSNNITPGTSGSNSPTSRQSDVVEGKPSTNSISEENENVNSFDENSLENVSNDNIND